MRNRFKLLSRSPHLNSVSVRLNSCQPLSQNQNLSCLHRCPCHLSRSRPLSRKLSIIKLISTISPTTLRDISNSSTSSVILILRKGNRTAATTQAKPTKSATTMTPNITTMLNLSNRNSSSTLKHLLSHPQLDTTLEAVGVVVDSKRDD